MKADAFAKTASRRPYDLKDAIYLPMLFKAASQLLAACSNSIDLSRGVGQLGPEEDSLHCVWLNEGRRLVFGVIDGDLVIVAPKNVDPDLPEPFADAEESADPAEPIAEQAAS